MTLLQSVETVSVEWRQQLVVGGAADSNIQECWKGRVSSTVHLAVVVYGDGTFLARCYDFGAMKRTETRGMGSADDAMAAAVDLLGKEQP